MSATDDPATTQGVVNNRQTDCWCASVSVGVGVRDIDSNVRLEDAGGKTRKREAWRPSRVNGRESGERVERRERRERDY